MTRDLTTQEWIEKSLAANPELRSLLERNVRSVIATCFDREGEPITHGEWSVLFECLEYRRIAFDQVGPYEVSTVWLGLDHSFLSRTPVIFETMVFEAELSWRPEFEYDDKTFGGYWYQRDFEQLRYTTMADALAGHAEVVQQCEAMMKASAAIDPRSEG